MVKTTTRLLHQAYSQAEAGNFQYAKALLESLVSIQPLNTEAWEAYLQLCQTCEELDYLCERITQVVGFHSVDIESILDYYYFLRRNLKLCQNGANFSSEITFELVDQFTYTLKDHPTGANSDQHFHKFVELPSWLLEKSKTIFFTIILIAGLKLLTIENFFGDWIVLTLMIMFSINLWISFSPQLRKKLNLIYHLP